jgi:DNA ligase (NAD+)
VGGVTISRATLHNENEVRRKDVRIGDKVRIARAGDVIPEVVERIEERGKKREKEFSMPGRCPVCGTEVVREGAYYLCPAGLSCPAQLIGRIVHYTSREALNIEGLSEKTARRLVEKGLVKDVADLYQLSVDDILTLEGFAQKSASQLYEAIQASKNPRLDRFLYALGIRHIGQHVAQVVAREYRTLEALQKASRDELAKIPEVGQEVATSIEEFFKREQNRKVIQRLMDAGMEVEAMPQRGGALSLEGKTFVFTGSLEKYTRSEAENLVESLGGRAVSSVSSQTDFLVAGEEPGSKLDEARKNNVKVIDEGEFEKMVSQ